VDSISRAVEVLGDWPLVYAWVEGKGPQLTVSQLGELGIRVVIFPLTAILSTLANLGNLYAALRRDGSPASMMDAMATFEEFNEFMGTAAASDRESRYT
jgi:2-methylisocitrate lyase-like PEP mutase family enzyme